MTESERKDSATLDDLSSDCDDEDSITCFDDIIHLIGSQGRFQKILLYLVVCPITAVEPFLTLNTVFLLFVPDHWCYIPGRDNETDLLSWKTLNIPLDFDRPVGLDGQVKFSHCTMYDGNDTIVACPNGWEYDKTEYESTISSAFNWVCDSQDNPTNAFTAAALGNTIGTLIFGHLADKVGRKPIFFLTIAITIIFRVISFFVLWNVNLFHLMQFFVGTAFPLMFIAPSMILAEICDKDYRGWVYSLTWMIWVVGMAALPLTVWLSKEWLITGIVTTVPGIFLFAYWFHLPESPRWLFSVGRLEEASVILEGVAKKNGTEVNLKKANVRATLQRLFDIKSQNETEGATGVWTLFSRKRLAKSTTLITICWSINVVVYYALTLNTTQMSGNQFVNFFLLSIIELPSGMCGAYLVDRVGRRWTQVAFFGGCTFSCIAAALVVEYLKIPVVEISAVVLAKFAITLTFLVVYLQGAEIFPTNLRSTGSGFASTMGAAFGITGPFIVALGTTQLSYPYWVMGSLCLLGTISAAFLPETLNQTLPETIEEADNFGKDNKFWSLYPSIRGASHVQSKQEESIKTERCDSNPKPLVNHINSTT